MVAPVQAVSVQSTAAVTSIASPSFTSTTGNLLVANMIEAANGSWTGTGMSDNGTSNTWATAVAQYAAAGVAQTRSSQAYAKNINGKAGHTCTFTVQSSDFISVAVVEISGADTTAPFDKPIGGSGNPTANPHASGSTPTTTLADEICVAGGTHNGSNNNTFASNNGYTVQTVQTNTTNMPIFLSTKIVSATGAQSESYNLTPNDSVTWMCFVGTYKAASGGATDPYPLGYRDPYTDIRSNAIYRM